MHSIVPNSLVYSSERSQDRDELMRMLTYKSVEEKVKRRVQAKAETYGQDISICEENNGSPPKFKIQPVLVAELYDEWIMPLTKEVQVEYLLGRLG